MAHIVAKDLVIDFPIYDNKSRSLRHRLVLDHIVKEKRETDRQISIGGKIMESEPGKVVVRALDGLNFEFMNGDRIGLLGHNGAGKSTLLKVLARIYEPIQGTIEIEGRPTPMFSLDDGMDPDSTGYENIWLRGRILGFTNADIEESIDSIAEFTDLGDYLNMPIRTYSSGMMVRLSFAIATAVEPDILIMDEMIGAGDAAFLEQAHIRLKSFVEKAGMVVVATHSTEVIRQWCNKAMLMEHGRIVSMGSPDEVIDAYTKSLA